MLNKITTQTNILICIMVSTWGATLAIARQIYNTVVRPAMAHKAAAWHACPGEAEMEPTRRHHIKRPVKKLIEMQNKCLQVIANIYKTILIAVLEIEIYISSLNLYLNTRL